MAETLASVGGGAGLSMGDPFQAALEAEGSRQEKDESDLIFVEAILRQRFGITYDDFAITLDKAIKAKNLDAGNGSGLEYARLADIPSVPLRWLWPGRIPAGKLTLLVGDPGLGKSVVSLDLAARVTVGAPWPGTGSHDGAQVGDVIILSAEDDPADTIRPRLEAVGADCSRILIVKSIRLKDGSRRSFSLADDLEALRPIISESVRLIIIDPISAYLGDTDSHVNTSVRAVLAPLAELAAETGAAILGISHLNKVAGAAIYRVQGSIAFTAAARAVWAIGKDPEDETGRHRLMLPVKCNLASDLGGLRYQLDDCQGLPVVHWGDAVEGDVTEAFSQEPAEDRSARGEAKRWLAEMLADGPQPATQIIRAAREIGIAERTLNRAKKSLGVLAEKAGFEGGWSWRLPPMTAKGAEEGQDGHCGNVGDLGDKWQSSRVVQGEMIKGAPDDW